MNKILAITNRITLLKSRKTENANIILSLKDSFAILKKVNKYEGIYAFKIFLCKSC